MTEAEARKNGLFYCYCGFKRYVEYETSTCSDIHHWLFIESDSDIKVKEFFFEEDILKEEFGLYDTVDDALHQAGKCLNM